MDKRDLIFIKPVEGRTAREPRSKIQVPPEGMFVAAGDMHWASLIRFGDIEVAEPPAEAPEHEHEGEGHQS